MRLQYFSMPAPDGDDRLLVRHIREGNVPGRVENDTWMSGCLLGGAVIDREVSEGRDPCRTCAGPRTRCGGRPMDLADAAEAVVRGANDSVNARKLFRQGQRVELARLLSKRS